MIAGTYKGGNVVELIATRAYSAIGDELGHVTTILATMTELRELMDHLEAQYREQSCCPSCGTLTLDGSTCADCLRYAESKYDNEAFDSDAALAALLEYCSER